MSNTDSPNNSSSDQEPGIPLPHKGDQSLTNLYWRQQELMAKWTPLSAAWRTASQYRELAEGVRRYQNSWPKINPALLQASSLFAMQAKLPQLPASLLESMSRIKDMNQRLAGIACTN